MASWTQQQPQHHQEQQQQQQHQQQQQQQQQQQTQHHQQSRNQQDLPMPQRQSDRMQQYQDMNSYLEPQQQSVQQSNTMSPISMMSPLDQNHGLMMSMSPQQQQPQDSMPHHVVGPSMLNQDMCNQSATQQNQMHPQQKSHLLPLLLSNRPASLKSIEHNEHAAHQLDLDHDQIIEQVISLENEYSDQSSAMTNFENNAVIMVGHQQQPQQHQHHHHHHQQQQQQQPQQQLGDSSLSNGACMQDSNQLSSSSEDLLNLLLEIDRDSSNVLSSGVQQLDQDEIVGIETIRKQLMSYDVQSDQLDTIPGSIHSPFDQLNCGSQQQQVESNHQTQQHNHQVHHGVQQQLISQTAPVIPHQQPQHQLSTPSLMQQRQQQLPHHHRLSVDQTLLHGSYSNTHPGNGVNVSSSIQSYNHQQHQNLARITQSTPMSMDNNSPSPSWQQPQLSPYSPQSEPVRPPSQRHPPLHHPIQPHHVSATTTPTTTSPPMQPLHHPSSQTRSQSQSISPTAKSEPSPVVKKNPLLNAQLVNSPGPSITPTRFISNQTNVLNQNPILNSKLSHGQGSRQRPKQQHQTTSLLKQLLSDDK